MKLCWIWQNCIDFIQFLTQKYSESNSNVHLHTKLVRWNSSWAQDFDSDYLEAIFPVQWTPPMGAVRPRSINCVNVCGRSSGVHWTGKLANSQDINAVDYSVERFMRTNPKILKCTHIKFYAFSRQNSKSRLYLYSINHRTSY